MAYKKIFHSILFLPLILIGIFVICHGDDGSSKDILKFPGFQVFKNEKKIEIDGRVNMNGGLIELLAATEQGKLHESVFALKCKPSDLHLALTILGMKEGGGPKYQGDPVCPAGDRVELYVEWNKDGQPVRLRAEDLVFDIKKQKPMPYVQWVFIGSKFIKDPNTGKDVYGADIEGSIVTTYHDPLSIFDNPLPEGGDDETYVANHEILPLPDTPVKFIIYIK